MNTRFLLFFVLLLSFLSCEQDLQDIDFSPREELLAPATAKGASNEAAHEVLADMDQLIGQLKATSEAQRKAGLAWYDEQARSGKDVELKEFLTDKLQVSAELYAKIQGYSPEKRELLKQEMGKPGKGELSATAGSAGSVVYPNVGSDGGPGGTIEARGCGWGRAIEVAVAVGICANDIDEGNYGGALGSCAHAGREVRDYYNDCA